MPHARRVPLSMNPSAANSPIRASGLTKPKRSSASIQREEAYGQPPPAKKQILDSGIPRPLKSPQQQRVAKTQLSLQSRRHASTYESKLARERSGQHHHHAETASTGKYTEKDLDEIRRWQSHHRQKFPKMVFYFDSIPEDTRAKLVKQIASLGAREERFFSSEITHVVTSRSIPPEQRGSRRADDVDADTHAEQQQPQTINPSLLDRTADQSVRRKLFTDALGDKSKSQLSSRSGLAQMSETRPKRSTDVLSRAREMSKKIWSLEKLNRMLSMLLETDLNVSAAIAYGSRSVSVSANHTHAKATDERSLLQLLQNERVNGPSDRDPTVTTKEMHYFRGPYLYIYDYEEKQKPIMAREYQRVQEKSDGDWPQFRTAPLGRCPFIEDYDHHREVVRPKKREVAKPAIESKLVLQPPEDSQRQAKPVTGKRSLSEMESAHNRGSSISSANLFNPSKTLTGKKFDFGPNPFGSRAATDKLFGGEPLASGVQPSNITSAIRSQMISSTAATPGAIGVVSKEVHGLQRKVLQRNSSHEMSSRRAIANTGATLKEDTESKRSALSRTSTKKLDQIDEQGTVDENEAAQSAKASVQAEKRVVKPKKKEPKPGYCENCQDKFADFDEHILSRKHRKFADNDDNWGDLDDLLDQLSREPKHKSYPTWAPALPEFPVY
ncbi:hypothetical protein E8E14_010132 [Neopestalotiopsis sp. 37M]|nr:hypothetical protein E8E14_010132 [Neopestalotiopsis sp. 37M]